MKFYRYFLTLVLFCTIYSFASSQALSISQGVEVEYLATVGDQEMYDQTDNCSLYINDGASMYIISKSDAVKTEKPKPIVSANGHLTYNLKTTSKFEKQYFIDYVSHSITSRLPMFDEVFIVTEEVPDFNWRITQESKTIAGYQCHMAVGSHRGRTFNAWFTPDIAISSGPWKFSGLPGLILEVNEQEKQYNWYCKSLKQLSTQGAKQISVPQGRKELSFAEFFDLAESKIKERLDKLTSNPNITVTGSFSLSKGLERTKE